MSGALQFARFAFPPNAYGYCGPADIGLVGELLDAGEVAAGEMRSIAQQFEGAWPYLEFLSDSVGSDPLARDVVEAYWIGNSLLADIDTLAWGNSVEERFHPRAGGRWHTLADGIPAGVPNHAFHVFCVYPWVGLLRAGYADHALTVIDQCRIRWGTVVEIAGGDVFVRSSPLVWDGRELSHGAPAVEAVRVPIEDGKTLSVGDAVALHWDYICQILSAVQLDYLVRYHDRHLAIANKGSHALARIVEA